MSGSNAGAVLSNGETESIGGMAAELVARLAQEAARPAIIAVNTEGLGNSYPERVPVLFDRRSGQGSSLKPLIEEYRGRPQRREGTAKVETLAAFIALTNRHKDQDSAIFSRSVWPEFSLTAVIDYHRQSAVGVRQSEGDEPRLPIADLPTDHEPRFGKHRVAYAFPVTDELKAWIRWNATAMEQAEFAAFLEEHAAELASPMDGERSLYEPLFKEKFATPSELLALSRDLEVHVGAKVRRAERLASGERTVFFVEEHMTGNGEPVAIPGIFIVSVPAWLDGDPVRIPARLRYRVAGGGIKWFYQLYRWDAFLREQVQHDTVRAAQETGLPAYAGAPEA